MLLCQPFMPVCQPPPSTHVLCQWYSWWCEPFPPSVSHTNTNEKVPQLPPAVEPIFLCHVFSVNFLRQNDKLKCLVEIGGLANLPFDKIMFFQFLQPPSFPDFLIDFCAPPKNKSCHASFPSSIYMPKSGRKLSWIKPPDSEIPLFWMSIKWMTNFPPLFCHNKKTKKEKALKMFRKFYLYPSIWDILDKVLDVVICSIDGYRKPRICSHFIGQSHHVFQTHSRMWTLSVVAGSYPLFLGVIRAIKELWKISVDLAHQKKNTPTNDLTPQVNNNHNHNWGRTSRVSQGLDSKVLH